MDLASLFEDLEARFSAELEWRAPGRATCVDDAPNRAELGSAADTLLAPGAIVRLRHSALGILRGELLQLAVDHLVIGPAEWAAARRGNLGATLDLIPFRVIEWLQVASPGDARATQRLAEREVALEDTSPASLQEQVFRLLDLPSQTVLLKAYLADAWRRVIRGRLVGSTDSTDSATAGSAIPFLAVLVDAATNRFAEAAIKPFSESATNPRAESQRTLGAAPKWVPFDRCLAFRVELVDN